MNTEERLRSEVTRHPYPLVFATISGAHLYGFPSPDSDYDLRGCHVLPVREVVGLDPGRETIESSTTGRWLAFHSLASSSRSPGSSRSTVPVAADRSDTNRSTAPLRSG